MAGTLLVMALDHAGIVILSALCTPSGTISSAKSRLLQGGEEGIGLSDLE